MKAPFFEIEGMKISCLSRQEALEAICGLNSGKIFFLNSHALMLARENLSFKEALQKATILLNDGVGMDLARLLIEGKKFPENLNGTDFIPEILANLPRGRVFFLGGRNFEKLQKEFYSRFPHLEFAGAISGHFKDTKVPLGEIEKAKPDIVIVGMGMPQQELLITENFETMQEYGAGLIIAGGAIIDFLSGQVVRAPLFIRKVRLEWLWRLLLEPRRLFHRYVIEGGQFLFWILRKAWKKRWKKQ
jgi:exopolysaccharide biosynthesis WecB/TagA/CpsF family protein